MFEAISYGCIPVILSDEIIWPFTNILQDFKFKAEDFTIQLPQTISYYHDSYFTSNKDEIQNQIDSSLSETRKNNIMSNYISDLSLFKDLPKSKINTLDLLKKSLNDKKNTEDKYIPPIIRILELIPEEDIIYLRENALRMSIEYQYYQFDKNMTEVPIHDSKR